MQFSGVIGVVLIAHGLLSIWGPAWFVKFLYPARRREATLEEYKLFLRKVSPLIIFCGLLLLYMTLKQHFG
jgi:hypothetical protein